MAVAVPVIRFAGPLDAFVMIRAVCTGFTLSREPPECTTLKKRHIHDVLFNVDPTPYVFGESLAYHKGGKFCDHFRT